ncbi:aspartate aminotransferase family protein [Tatumella ptyseos]|uniref:aspartate aminotransferase family protein n=1 Tax=Tatumella ptyseos TaxID=82987 RepID=UPI0023F3AA55|nr:aspartate aminotransferase family protein [Tatumella ptyseos]
MSEVMTAFPASNDHWLDARNREIPAGLVTVHPLVIEKGRGAEVWDVEGTRYLDFAGGSGGLNIGHNHPAVVSAITRQLNQFTGDCFRVAASPLYIRLACRLNQLVGGDEAFQTVFFNTGADAVAQAVNSARAFTGRPGIITFEGAFHHSSLADCRLTGHSPVGQADSAHGASDVCSLPYPDSSRGISEADCRAALWHCLAGGERAGQVAAILLEPIQGESGIIPAPASFMQYLQRICRQYDMLLICDELQSGFGRTGEMFAYEQSGVMPDLVITGNPGTGLPMSAVTGRRAVMNASRPVSPQGGNALACAAALAVLEVLGEEDLLNRSLLLGERLSQRLVQMREKYACLRYVRGRGLMLAVEIVDPDTGKRDAALAQAILDAACIEGLLLVRCGLYRNVIRFLAPLVTTNAQLEEAFHLFELALARATGRL